MKSIIKLISSLSLVIMLSACGSDDGQSAGDEKIQDAVTNMKAGANDLKDSAEDKINNMQKQAQEKAQEMGDDAKQGLANTEEKIKGVLDN